MTPPPRAETDNSAEPVRLGPTAAGRCRRRIHLDAAQPAARREPSAAAQRTREELAEHRAAVLTELVAVHPGAVRPADDRWRRQRSPMVLNPAMSTPQRSGGADLLLWAGDGYLPVIIRAHRTRESGSGARCTPLAGSLDRPLDARPDPDHRARRQRADRLALSHHYRQLVELGCASKVARGGVIGRGSATDGAGRPDQIGDEDDAGVIVWHDLDSGAAGPLSDYDSRFSDRLAVARAAVDGRSLAQPSRIAECRRCPWWPTCSAELLERQDISLVLVGGDVAAARAAGIRTVPDLATLDGAELAGLAFSAISPGHARVRARAWQLGLPVVRSGSRAALRRADVELDVDAESYGEDGPYLWGAQLSGADVGLPAGFRAFVTWEQLPSVHQAAAFGRFFDHLQAVRAAATARGLSFAAFCYGKEAEERWMFGLARRYAGTEGVPSVDAVAEFCASPHWVDLLQDLKRHFVVPGSLRLKEIAGGLGFSWRDPEPGGENSMAWYRSIVHGPSGVDAADPMAQRILRYNEDDVLATLAVRRSITERLSRLPTVVDLESPDWRSVARSR